MTIPKQTLLLERGKEYFDQIQPESAELLGRIVCALVNTFKGSEDGEIGDPRRLDLKVALFDHRRRIEFLSYDGDLICELTSRLGRGVWEVTAGPPWAMKKV